ncbi:MAG: hypothetical protein QM704_21535 [Anaeromyxobacteraceae bacterium]
MTDSDCVTADRYVTGECDTWVTLPEAEQVLNQMRESTEAACHALPFVQVAPACPATRAACVEGTCRAAEALGAEAVIKTVNVVPTDFQCLGTGLARVTSEKRLPDGMVKLRFPLGADGNHPRYFEALGSHEPEAAVAVARVVGSCQWKMQDGSPIRPGVWGFIAIKLKY